MMNILTEGHLKSICLGQILSVLITGTGICSTMLAVKYEVNIPTTQSFLNYFLLSFYSIVLCTTGSFKESFRRAYYYIPLAIIDVEANYFVVKAYQFTSITSVMLLDCFTIPIVMILSRIFLKATYKTKQFIGVGVCVIGLIVLILSDYFYNNRKGGRNPLLGDFFCILGSLLYAISNVSQEALVKKFSKLEYLSMLGLWGCLVNGLQLLILERSELSRIKWELPIAILIVVFALCLFGMYSLTPLMMSLASATLFNLSLLTSDAYAIIAGVVLFSQVPSFLYFIALVIIVSGLIMYNHGSESPEEYRKLTGTLQQSYQQQELKKLEEEKPIIH